MSPLWLKSLPWSTILSNAPLIVEGAKKLASLVKSKPAEEVIAQATDAFHDDASELSALRARVQRLEEEQGRSVELVRTMAETQAQMAQVLEAFRIRGRLSMRVAMISLVGVGMLLIWVLTH
jgi:ATP/maltotriose-dependent transcriptional regulator MalT